MKLKRARELRAAWGDAPCEHPQVARLYDDAGERTGAYACTTCGHELSFREKVERSAGKKGEESQ